MSTANDHALTVEWSGEYGAESSSTGTCRCGWQESASSQDEVRFEYREHLRRVLVEGVKAHALAHYEDGGWDVVVECWGDGQIAEHVKGARTIAGAVRRFEDVVSVWADRQADARNSAF